MNRPATDHQPLPSATSNEQLSGLIAVLQRIVPRVIACSGGIDSLLLATLAHRQNPQRTLVAHAVSPAVPAEATVRVREWADREGWNLEIVSSGEFEDEDYLNNPSDRCYYCKSNLYSSLDLLARSTMSDATLLSGANLDDLGEYRPGLVAASENGVRHPLIEAEIDKEAIRSIARHLNLSFAELPASPCLASRIYTGTRVTADRLKAIEAGEMQIRRATGIDVVRCRVKESGMYIEVNNDDREQISRTLLDSVMITVQAIEPGISAVQLDAEPYRSGRAFVVEP